MAASVPLRAPLSLSSGGSLTGEGSYHIRGWSNGGTFTQPSLLASSCALRLASSQTWGGAEAGPQRPQSRGRASRTARAWELEGLSECPLTLDLARKGHGGRKYQGMDRGRPALHQRGAGISGDRHRFPPSEGRLGTTGTVRTGPQVPGLLPSCPSPAGAR